MRRRKIELSELLLPNFRDLAIERGEIEVETLIKL